MLDQNQKMDQLHQSCIERNRLIAKRQRHDESYDKDFLGGTSDTRQRQTSTCRLQWGIEVSQPRGLLLSHDMQTHTYLPSETRYSTSSGSSKTCLRITHTTATRSSMLRSNDKKSQLHTWRWSSLVLSLPITHEHPQSMQFTKCDYIRTSTWAKCSYVAYSHDDNNNYTQSAAT